MTSSTLRIVTLETVANYRQVAEHAVGAYRASGHRLLDLVSRSFDRSSARIVPQLAAAVRQTSARVSDAAARGIDSVSAQTERVIELGSTGFSTRIDRVADLVEGIENRYVATSLQTAARFSLSGAQAALTLSEKLAAGADKLAEVVGGKPVRGTASVARAKTAVKAARRATAPAKPRISKAPGQLAKRVKAPARRAAKVVQAKPVQAKAPRRVAAKAQRHVAAKATKRVAAAA